MKAIPIVYENDEALIVNKPAGLAVQGGAGVSHPLDKELPLQLGCPVFLVHRLDMDTAGLLIVAKSSAAAAKWTRLMSGKLVQKEYAAVCAGHFQKKSGAIRTHVIQRGEAKPAETLYSVLKEAYIDCKGEKIAVSLVRLLLKTGRMHQIRIHLASLSHPILGDDKHGDFALNKRLKKSAGVKRLFLVSNKLSIPLDGKNAAFEIPLPDYMEDFIEKLTASPH
ncbi:MAG: RluA family pseudouridine synthase [Treponema sp.]